MVRSERDIIEHVSETVAPALNRENWVQEVGAIFKVT